MSTLSSGRACWVAVLLAAMLLSRVAANSAIITSQDESGQWDVSLNITHIDVAPGLESWDDLAFTTLQGSWFSNATGDLSIDVLEKMAVLDIASGTLCQDTDGCMDNVDSHYQSLVDKASNEAKAKVEKRFRYIFKWISAAWKLDKKHAVTAGALGALSNTVAGSTDAIIKLSRSATCGKNTDGKQGCISWSGGIQAIKKSIALDIISSAQQNFGQDAVSGEEYAAVFDEVSSRRRKRSSHNVCISNLTNGCTGP